MRKVIVFAVIAMLVLLAACGGNKIAAKPLSSRTPTAAATTPEPAPSAPEPAPEMTAAQAIKELQEQMQNTPATTTTTSPKTATTGMPPAPAGVTGKDALLARTRALYSTGSGVNGISGGVVTDFPDYRDESNLPKEYQQGGQYD
jgi:hypothetical protein